jgi:hypothetical protein
MPPPIRLSHAQLSKVTCVVRFNGKSHQARKSRPVIMAGMVFSGLSKESGGRSARLCTNSPNQESRVNAATQPIQRCVVGVVGSFVVMVADSFSFDFLLGEQKQRATNASHIHRQLLPGVAMVGRMPYIAITQPSVDVARRIGISEQRVGHVVERLRQSARQRLPEGTPR